MGHWDEREGRRETKRGWRRGRSERANKGGQTEGGEGEGKRENGERMFQGQTLVDKSDYRRKRGILRRGEEEMLMLKRRRGGREECKVGVREKEGEVEEEPRKGQIISDQRSVHGGRLGKRRRRTGRQAPFFHCHAGLAFWFWHVRPARQDLVSLQQGCLKTVPLMMF